VQVSKDKDAVLLQKNSSMSITQVKFHFRNDHNIEVTLQYMRASPTLNQFTSLSMLYMFKKSQTIQRVHFSGETLKLLQAEVKDHSIDPKCLGSANIQAQMNRNVRHSLLHSFYCNNVIK
jgi:hypothetical protein